MNEFAAVCRTVLANSIFCDQLAAIDHPPPSDFGNIIQVVLQNIRQYQSVAVELFEIPFRSREWRVRFVETQ